MSESTQRFRATATWDGEWFAVEIHDLPRNCAGATQGRTPEEARSMAVEAIALLLDVPEETIDVDLTFVPPLDVVITDPENANE